MSGGAAEVMQARRLERIVRQTDALTAVQVLHRRLVVETAAFEQQDLVPRADPFERHADAGRAGAHDAQVGFEHAAVRKGSSVDVHGGTSGVRPRGERRGRFGAPRLARPPIPAAPSSARPRSPARPPRRWIGATVALREWQRTARAPHSRWARARGTAVRCYAPPAVRSGRGDQAAPTSAGRLRRWRWPHACHRGPPTHWRHSHRGTGAGSCSRPEHVRADIPQPGIDDDRTHGRARDDVGPFFAREAPGHRLGLVGGYYEDLVHPIPMPSIWCEPDGFPESTAASAVVSPSRWKLASFHAVANWRVR